MYVIGRPTMHHFAPLSSLSRYSLHSPSSPSLLLPSTHPHPPPKKKTFLPHYRLCGDPPQVARKGYEEARVLACQRRPLEGILSPSPPNTLPQPLGKRGGVGRIDITVTYVDPAREACRHPFQETAWSRAGGRDGEERGMQRAKSSLDVLSAL